MAGLGAADADLGLAAARPRRRDRKAGRQAKQIGGIGQRQVVDLLALEDGHRGGRLGLGDGLAGGGDDDDWIGGLGRGA